MLFTGEGARGGGAFSKSDFSSPSDSSSAGLCGVSFRFGVGTGGGGGVPTDSSSEWIFCGFLAKAFVFLVGALRAFLTGSSSSLADSSTASSEGRFFFSGGGSSDCSSSDSTTLGRVPEADLLLEAARARVLRAEVLLRVREDCGFSTTSSSSIAVLLFLLELIGADGGSTEAVRVERRGGIVQVKHVLVTNHVYCDYVVCDQLHSESKGLLQTVLSCCKISTPDCQWCACWKRVV